MVQLYAGDATVYHATLLDRQRRYEAVLAAGTHRPLLFPWDCLPVVYLLLALMFVPRLPRPVGPVLRGLAVAAILAHSLYVMRVCRMTGLVGGYGIGFFFAWVCIVSCNLLVFSRVDVDFQRLEARPRRPWRETNDPQANGSAALRSTGGGHANGTARPKQRQKGGVDADHPAPMASRNDGHDQPYELEWQGYPSGLMHRLDWTLDLISAFRGVNWNFRLSTLPKLQPAAEKASTRTMQQVRWEALFNLACWYVVIDVMKTLHSDDAFFAGVVSFYDPPAPSTALYGTNIYVAMFARLVITMLSVHAALNFLFQLSPIFFSLVLPCVIPYPRLLSVTRTPLLTPSMYEPLWGPFLPSLTARGLGGFWSGFWHHLIRLGISQPSTYLVQRAKLDPKSSITRTVQVLLAFALSGMIHAFGAYTSFPPVPASTRPLTRTFAFFLAQAAGVIIQAYLARAAVKSRPLPPWLRHAGNFLFAFVWLCLTGPGLAEDTARCGAWLFEALPVSIVRGLRGDGWWRWGARGGRWYGWWRDPRGRWWHTGYGLY